MDTEYGLVLHFDTLRAQNKIHTYRLKKTIRAKTKLDREKKSRKVMQPKEHRKNEQKRKLYPTRIQRYGRTISLDLQRVLFEYFIGVYMNESCINWLFL